MGTMQRRNAKYQASAAAPICSKEPSWSQAAYEDGVGATVDALDGMEKVLANESFEHPDTLTHEGITAYALALLRLRECASVAGLDRLTNACDALAVTVSRLIEDKSCASLEKCEALTRFIAHAWAMIQMGAVNSARYAMPVAVPPLPDGNSMERTFLYQALR